MNGILMAFLYMALLSGWFFHSAKKLRMVIVCGVKQDTVTVACLILGVFVPLMLMVPLPLLILTPSPAIGGVASIVAIVATVFWLLRGTFDVRKTESNLEG